VNEEDIREIKLLFPNLSSSSFSITSPKSRHYNCIAWAAGDTEQWWWPDEMNQEYWPEDAPRLTTLNAFIIAYGKIGYELCNDGSLENGFEKIAIYINPQGVPTHAARQLLNGKWTSKLGNLEDIEHSLDGLEGFHYGTVAKLLKRKID